MKKLIASLLLITSANLHSQINEGQKFCEENSNGNYFPLTIEKKKILWANTSYYETQNGIKSIKGKKYKEYVQEWSNNNSDKLYLREEDGVVYQYEECCEKETIRYDKRFEKGHTWKTADGKTEYKITSYNGKLKTPFCEYTNLLVIKATIENYEILFYYLKGHGYIGASIDNKIISCVTPIWD